MMNVRQNRRREVRTPAAGVVKIVVEGGLTPAFEGELIDLSSSGFRVAHKQLSLERGAEVDFRYQEGHGKARVAWNRVAGGQVETGFLVL